MQGLDLDPPGAVEGSEALPHTRCHSRSDSEPTGSSKQARVEDAEEEFELGGIPRNPFVEHPGSSHSAGKTYGKVKSLYETIHEERERGRDEPGDEDPWSPYTSKEEWDLVKWLVECGVSQGDIDKFLKLEIVCFPTSVFIITA